MAQFTSPFVERLVLAPQTVFNQVPNTAGVWTPTGAKMLRAGSGAKLKADPTLITNPVKTGTRSPQPGIAGRRSNNTWSLPATPIIPSGTPATAPDMDLLFQLICGQAPVAGVYSIIDSVVMTCILARFQHLEPTLTQQFGIGALCTDWSIEINGDILTLSANGQFYWVLDSDNFANEDVPALGGLTAFPLELAAPTVLGTLQQGFLGTATFDGDAVDTTTFPLIKASIKGRTGNSYTQDAFGSSYGALPSGGRRMVSTAFTFQDCNTAFLSNLKVAAKSKRPIAITYTVGTVAGSILTIPLKGVQVAGAEYTDEAARVVSAFTDSEASASTISAVDEVGFAFS
jgi:hypothetical protein